MIEVGIVGGSGYGAVELIRLLAHHPSVKIKYIFSHSKAGELVSGTFPHLNHLPYRFESLENEQISLVSDSWCIRSFSTGCVFS